MPASSIVIKDLIEAIKALQLEIHGRVEDSVISQLDKVILELEGLLEESKSSSSSNKALELFAICLDAVGIGLALYQLFTESCR